MERKQRRILLGAADIAWRIMEWMGLIQLAHMLICCNFVLDLGSWHGKPSLPKQEELSYTFRSRQYDEWYWDWIHMMHLESRFIRANVQLLGTICNVIFIALSVVSLACTPSNPAPPPLLLSNPVVNDLRCFHGDATLAQNTAATEIMFNGSVFCLIFSTFETLLIFLQLLAWDLFSYNMTPFVAHILDLERFATSLWSTRAHAKLFHSDVDVYGLTILNIALSSLYYPLNSTQFSIVSLLKAVITNVVYFSSVSHTAPHNGLQWQWVRMNVVLLHMWLITSFLYMRAQEDCRRRLFGLLCLPYLVELSRLLRFQYLHNLNRSFSDYLPVHHGQHGAVIEKTDKASKRPTIMEDPPPSSLSGFHTMAHEEGPKDNWVVNRCFSLRLGSSTLTYGTPQPTSTVQDTLYRNKPIIPSAPESCTATVSPP